MNPSECSSSSERIYVLQVPVEEAEVLSSLSSGWRCEANVGVKVHVAVKDPECVSVHRAAAGLVLKLPSKNLQHH